ncbi:MAG TPA: hypothetical protein VLT36_02935 [Candidatus Dormibacteraeota bacterium]|nr:hypothetical protein [Candidatus Dormibacteraeota bacterium]
MSRARALKVVVPIAAVLLALTLLGLLARVKPIPTDVGAVRTLPGGTILRLEKVVLTNGSFNYMRQSGNKWARMIAPALPPFLRNRISISGGGFGFGGDGNTNLILITVTSYNSSPGNSANVRLAA